LVFLCILENVKENFKILYILCRRILLTATIVSYAFIGKAQNIISGKILMVDGSPATNVNIELRELKKKCSSDAD
jgi:hypothetical protein